MQQIIDGWSSKRRVGGWSLPPPVHVSKSKKDTESQTAPSGSACSAIRGFPTTIGLRCSTQAVLGPT